MPNILTRTITGAVYVSLIVFSLLIHPAAFGIITILLNYFALAELNAMSVKFKIQLSNHWIVANSFFMIIAIALIQMGYDSSFVLLPLLGIPVTLFTSTIFMNTKTPVLNMAFALFCTVYITVPFVLLNLLQIESFQTKIPFVLAIFIIIWTNDTFAYLAGISFGKHKMMKRISPLKSWEGFIGGSVMVVPVLYVFYRLYPSIGLLSWTGLGILTVISAVIGDFLESLIKRSADTKDSGILLPGHGGILDRIDSLLITIPVIFFYLKLLIKL
ncbi:MAG: phosphatidate cytidylyltransferase [Bacteroidales bacterium]|nr:phosphatidate cytidylyltransferase [Bacteroidales bacterium]